MENDYVPVALLKIKPYKRKETEQATIGVGNSLRDYLIKEGFRNFDIDVNKKKGTLELSGRINSESLSILEKMLNAFCSTPGKKKPYTISYEMYSPNYQNK